MLTAINALIPEKFQYIFQPERNRLVFKGSERRGHSANFHEDLRVNHPRATRSGREKLFRNKCMTDEGYADDNLLTVNRLTY